MAPIKIHARDKTDRVVAFVGDKIRRDAHFPASAKTIPSIEYTSLEQNDGVLKPISGDIGLQFLVFVEPHRWKKLRKWMWFKYQLLAHRLLLLLRLCWRSR